MTVGDDKSRAARISVGTIKHPSVIDPTVAHAGWLTNCAECRAADPEIAETERMSSRYQRGVNMRKKPDNLVGASSDSMWQDFNAVCDRLGIGESRNEWVFAWECYYAGYERRHAEVMGAMA